MIKKNCIRILIIMLFASCEKIFMNDPPATDPMSIYEEYWKIVSEKFSMFSDPVKNINKQELYKSTKSKITPEMTDAALFKVLAEITLALKDNHSTLQDPKTNRFASYNSGRPYNHNEEVIEAHYLKQNAKSIGKNENRGTSALQYVILSKNVGYIRLKTFEDVELTSGMLDEVLRYFKDTKGLILDVRGNTGGSPFVATTVARHFTNKKVFVGTDYFKTGPGENDFSASKIYVTPQGVYYAKPLIVLTDSGCYSATSLMIAYLRAIRNAGRSDIWLMGEKTEGGMGNATEGYLANGWIWQVSSTEFREFDGKRYDNGVDPDIVVRDDSSTQDKDEVIEKAIKKINAS